MHLPSLPALPAVDRFTRKLPRWWWKAALGVVGVGVVVVVARRNVKLPNFYWQDDKPWGPTPLGFGSESIGDAGCLLTCVTMASNALARTDFDPGDVNDVAKSGEAFSGSLLKLPEAAATVGLRAPDEERIHSQSGASVHDLAARIDETLKKRGVAVVNVDHSYTGPGAHFVLVHGGNAREFLAADPAGDGDVNPQEITIDRATLTASSTWNSHPVVVGVAPVYKA